MYRSGVINLRARDERSLVHPSPWLLIGLLFCLAIAVVVIGVRYYFMPPDPQFASMGLPHQNHKPQHGGQFFMAEDNIHHLEGVLLNEGTLRLYIYDAYTVALPPDGIRETTGTVEVGESDGRIPLHVSPDGSTLQAEIGRPVKFPIELNVRLHLPGEAIDKKPELFTFDFNAYSTVVN